MIITTCKDIEDIIKFLEGEKSVFIVGCGECSTVCKTGGEKEVLDMKASLEKKGYAVTGYCIPDAPCTVAQIRSALRENKKAIDGADSILVLTCGLGAQSVKDNFLSEKTVHIGCDTQFMGQVCKDGVLLERCSGCGDCILELTDMICPITRCPKALLNGPCGGQNKGKCEVDKDMDCAWVLIYKALKEKNKLHLLKESRPPKDHSKMLKPRRLKV